MAWFTCEPRLINFLGDTVMYEDEKLICEDCGCEFVFTAGEQEFYAEKGLTNKPKRCQNCRKAEHETLRLLYRFQVDCYSDA